MTTLTLMTEPAITGVNFDGADVVFLLVDGRKLSVPLDWYPRLLYGTGRERSNWQLLGDGYAVEWPGLDEHIGVEGLLAGRRSSETRESLERWLALRTEDRELDALQKFMEAKGDATGR